MIVLNGILGLCLLIGGIRHHFQTLQPQSATSALGVLATLAVLAMVLPNYTLAVPGPLYAPAQLIFVAVVSLALYGLFLHAQTVRHRADFADPNDADTHTPVPAGAFRLALGLLPVALLAVVLLAEVLAEPVAGAVAGAGLPEALVGVAIAMVVLMPEGVAALRAAKANRLQTAINLSLGSALASLCLTIPTVAMISLWLGQDLVLGLDAEHIVLLVLSLFITTLTLAMGRTTALQGGIHIVIFGAFLTLSAIPGVHRRGPTGLEGRELCVQAGTLRLAPFGGQQGDPVQDIVARDAIMPMSQRGKCHRHVQHAAVEDLP